MSNLALRIFTSISFALLFQGGQQRFQLVHVHVLVEFAVDLDHRGGTAVAQTFNLLQAEAAVFADLTRFDADFIFQVIDDFLFAPSQQERVRQMQIWFLPIGCRWYMV
jgi:hypothetical protein